MPYSKYFLRISLAFIVIILLHTLYHRVVLEKFSTTPSYSIPQDLDIHRSIPTKIPSVTPKNSKKNGQKFVKYKREFIKFSISNSII